MMYGNHRNLAFLASLYRAKGVLRGNHQNGWYVLVNNQWRRKSTRVGAFQALGVDKHANPEYFQAGRYMEQGLLKGSHATGWSAKLNGSFVVFPTRCAAVQALGNVKATHASSRAT